MRKYKRLKDILLPKNLLSIPMKLAPVFLLLLCFKDNPETLCKLSVSIAPLFKEALPSVLAEKVIDRSFDKFKGIQNIFHNLEEQIKNVVTKVKSEKEIHDKSYDKKYELQKPPKLTEDEKAFIDYLILLILLQMKLILFNEELLKHHFKVLSEDPSFSSLIQGSNAEEVIAKAKRTEILSQLKTEMLQLIDSHQLKINIERFLRKEKELPKHVIFHNCCDIMLKKSISELVSQNTYNPLLLSRNYELEKIVRDYLRSDKSLLVIYGKAGAGKTFALMQIAEDLSDEVPVLYFKCQELIDGNLIQSCLRFISSRLGLKSWNEFLDFVCEVKESIGLLLLLDGLEKVSLNMQEKIMAEIAQISKATTKLKVIVTCRENTWINTYFHFRDAIASRIYIHPRHITLFKEKYGIHILGLSRERLIVAYNNHKELYGFNGKVLPGSKLLNELMISPLMLKIVSEVYCGRNLPETVATWNIFEEYWNKLIPKSEVKVSELLKDMVRFLYEQETTYLNWDDFLNNKYKDLTPIERENLWKTRETLIERNILKEEKDYLRFIHDYLLEFAIAKIILANLKPGDIIGQLKGFLEKSKDFPPVIGGLEFIALKFDQENKVYTKEILENMLSFDEFKISALSIIERARQPMNYIEVLSKLLQDKNENIRFHVAERASYLLPPQDIINYFKRASSEHQDQKLALTWILLKAATGRPEIRKELAKREHSDSELVKTVQEIMSLNFQKINLKQIFHERFNRKVKRIVSPRGEIKSFDVAELIESLVNAKISFNEALRVLEDIENKLHPYISTEQVATLILKSSEKMDLNLKRRYEHFVKGKIIVETNEGCKELSHSYLKQLVESQVRRKNIKLKRKPIDRITKNIVKALKTLETKKIKQELLLKIVEHTTQQNID